MGFLEGKKCLIAGLASKRSIAWGIASAMHRQGAELAFTYQGEKLRDRVTDMAAELGSDIVIPMDVSHDENIEFYILSLLYILLSLSLCISIFLSPSHPFCVYIT